MKQNTNKRKHTENTHTQMKNRQKNVLHLLWGGRAVFWKSVTWKWATKIKMVSQSNKWVNPRY